LTLVELRMRALAGQILEKPNWWNKVRDGEITDKWRREFVEQDAELVKKFWPELQQERDDDDEDKTWPHKNITEEQLNYIFDWLKWLADQRNTQTGIEMMHIQNVYQSYSLITSELREALLQGASILESIPEAEKDWHPGSNNQVLDLIHPSLHCLRIGKSLVKNTKTGSLYVPTVEEYINAREDLSFLYSPSRWMPHSVSIQHQWLPTDFSVSETGEVKHLSYINNLHPDDHKPLYSTITSILARFVPLWERVLSDVLSRQRPIIELDPYSWYEKGRATPEPELEDWVETPDAAYWEAWDVWCVAHEAWEHRKDPFICEPKPFTPPATENQVNFTLKGRKIQVIVKMANIVLTPEKPEYAGGSWHVEGMDNEKIVATGIYYYDSSNVTESKLSFRTAL
ncbi:hypothetical protein NEOLEDRAFT_1052463, partial [Neolentinus lepideus HHB14362 ss-1]